MCIAAMEESKVQVMWSCDIHTTLPLQIGKEGYAAAPPITVGELFRKTRDAFPDNVALSWKDGDEWKRMTYVEYYNECVRAAKSFLKLGLESMHAVAFLGFNSPEWVITDLGSIFAGGVSCCVNTSNNPEVCQYIASDCQANIAVVADQEQLDKFLQIKGNLPHLKAIIQYKGKLSKQYSNVYDWEEFMKLGDDTDDKIVEDKITAQKPEDHCTLIYTSGTTGDPKGVMCTHDNITWTSLWWAVETPKSYELGNESVVSYSPPSHISAKLIDIYTTLHLAGTVYFAQPDALKGTLVVTLREAQPTQFYGHPKVWEILKDALQESMPPLEMIKSLPEEKLKEVQAKAKADIGLGHCKIAATGSAPIHQSTPEFFQTLGLPIISSWGMTEGTGPITATTLTDLRPGSIGKVSERMEVRISDPDSTGQGEICFRGRSRMSGYLNKREKTMEAIDGDGWMHSGDLGRVDKDGFYYITGRIKELIITSEGGKIAPVPIEDRIKKEVPFLSNVLVVGDNHNYLTCLMTLKCVMDPPTGKPTDSLDPEAIALVSALGSTATKVSKIIDSEDAVIFKAIQTGLENANKGAISNAQKVQKWKLLREDFSVPGGELGSTLKVKRFFVLKKYSEIIDSLYN